MKVKIENKEYNVIDSIDDIKIKSINDITNLNKYEGIHQMVELIRICSDIEKEDILKLTSKSLNDLVTHLTPIVNQFNTDKKIKSFRYKGVEVKIKDMETLSVADIITIESKQDDLITVLNIILDFDTALDRIEFINDLPAHKLLSMINYFFLNYQKSIKS